MCPQPPGAPTPWGLDPSCIWGPWALSPVFFILHWNLLPPESRPCSSSLRLHHHRSLPSTSWVSFSHSASSLTQNVLAQAPGTLTHTGAHSPHKICSVAIRRELNLGPFPSPALSLSPSVPRGSQPFGHTSLPVFFLITRVKLTWIPYHLEKTLHLPNPWFLSTSILLSLKLGPDIPHTHRGGPCAHWTSLTLSLSTLIAPSVPSQGSGFQLTSLP